MDLIDAVAEYQDAYNRLRDANARLSSAQNSLAQDQDRVTKIGGEVHALVSALETARLDVVEAIKGK